MEDTKKNVLLRSFFRRFYLLTEGIAFLVMAPVTVLIVFNAIYLEKSQVPVYFGLVALMILVSIIISLVSTRKKVIPLLNYFSKIIEEEQVDEQVYIDAYSCYTNLPKKHAIDTALRWILTMGAVIILLNVFATPSITDNFNMWMLLFINTTFSALLFFLISERLLIQVARLGLFSDENHFTPKSRIGRYLSVTMISMMAFLVFIMIVVVHNLMSYRFMLVHSDKLRLSSEFIEEKLKDNMGTDGSVNVKGLIPDKNLIENSKVYITDNDTRVLASTSSDAVNTVLDEKLAADIKTNPDMWRARYLKDDTWYRTVITRSSTGDKLIIVSIKESIIERQLLRTTFFMIAFLAVSLSIIGFFSYRIINQRIRPLRKLKNTITELADGDISQVLVITSYDEIGEILANVDKLIKKLTDVLKNIKSISGELASSSEEMKSTTESFSTNAQDQAANSEEITATVEEVSAGIDSISNAAEYQAERLDSMIETLDKLSGLISGMDEKTAQTQSQTEHIADRAQSGEEALMDMSQTMKKITESSTQMTGVIEIINDISDQINLLSLNAAIEAARAGDAGKGFAVVADQISKLADQTSSSIKDIDNLIKENNSEIEKGISNLKNTSDIITVIISGVTSINERMNEIAEFMKGQLETNSKVNSESMEVKNRSDEIKNASSEQRKASTEIVNTITSISDLSQQNASGSEELSASASSLSSMAETLKDAVDYFKI